MAGNTLGCGRYTAQIRTRGGGGVLFDKLPCTDGTWERVLDDTSQAGANLAGLGRTDECFEAIRDGEPMQYELAVARDGGIVWQGPLGSKQADGTKGSYAARDLSAWWDRRVLPVDRIYSQTDLAVIFQQLATDAMLEDPSPNISVATTATGVLGDRKYLAGQNLYVGPELRSLSKAGVDWTMVGRNVLAGGVVVPTSPIVLLQDRHLVGPPSVSVDGMSMANRVRVVGVGGGEGIDPIVGEARDEASIAKYGLIDAVIRDESIRDVVSARAAAASRLALSRVPVPILTQITLDADAPVDVDELVPGALVGCAFTSSGIEVAGEYRIKKVACSFKGAGETISLTVMPPASGGDDS